MPLPSVNNPAGQAAASQVSAVVPAKPGCYVLVLHLNRARRLAVGRHSSVEFSPGYYLYVGSAFGPGGLRARLRRHAAGSSRRHWHVDYLREVSEPVEAWFQLQTISREHEWAASLGRGRGLRPVAAFGASDCSCTTHLYLSDSLPRCAAFRARLPPAHAPTLPVRRIGLVSYP